MTTLYVSPIYISLTFIARFTCSNGLVCCVCDKVNCSDKAGFHAIEGYWEGVTANHSYPIVKQIHDKYEKKYPHSTFGTLSR
jgi:hypothetical protein